jgi:hypothetical protein
MDAQNVREADRVFKSLNVAAHAPMPKVRKQAGGKGKNGRRPRP